MVSYMRVQLMPAIYRGRQTDQSQLPCTAEKPSSAPQLNVKPWGKCQNINYFTSIIITVDNPRLHCDISTSSVGGGKHLRFICRMYTDWIKNAVYAKNPMPRTRQPTRQSMHWSAHHQHTTNTLANMSADALPTRWSKFCCFFQLEARTTSFYLIYYDDYNEDWKRNMLTKWFDFSRTS